MTTSQFIQQNLGDISVYRLSKLTGFSITNLSKYIKGSQEPSIPKFKAIVKALNIPDSEIVNFIKQ